MTCKFTPPLTHQELNPVDTEGVGAADMICQSSWGRHDNMGFP